jgi:hypothetical protein
MTKSLRRTLLGALLVGGLALLFEFLFARATDGLITPESKVDYATAALGVLALGTRLIALFGIPIVLGYKAGVFVVDGLQKRFATRRGLPAGRR